jgi:hypothetical protein
LNRLGPRREIIHRVRLAVIVVVAVLVCGFAYVTLTDNSEVDDYCTYGAVSQAQLDQCVAHVDEATVHYYAGEGTPRRRPTNAALYAVGSSTAASSTPTTTSGTRAPSASPVERHPRPA